ncbi:MAG: tRNA (guanosine(37)-N1)-methyltransferase TrmD [bacterium]|nr:tRNA (guanosine(37)-N1)-methyltransferase TrmD [bacterium]
MKFDILTIFPQMFDAYMNESILKRAQEKKLILIKAHDIRKFSKDKHRKVDDRPFGGGAGMVMAFQPIATAVAKLKAQSSKLKARTILFSTRGKKFTNDDARRLAKYDQMIFICGRYEGVDERVAQYIADEEISIGDYVLTGGELPAMVVIDSVSRQIPGVLGKAESLEEAQGSYPTYTRPEAIKSKVKSQKFKVIKVPPVLLSGDHAKIEEWRKLKGK